MTIKEIQEWEKAFVKKQGIPQDKEFATKAAILKLMEEVGEVAKAILEGDWDEVQAEVSDIIMFACKISNVAEEFHGAENLTDVFKRKLKYCESRKYDSKIKKLDKPKNKEFK